jgi:tRNA modification GTPase
MPNDFSDTIVALSTPPGAGAIGVIRLSGPDAVQLVNLHFKGKNLEKQASHTIHFGNFHYKDELIDEVLVSLFLAPTSYTKEDVVEISCHGSPYIQQKIIEALIESGAVPAKPGEFTLRAYLHGRFDLSQAEAVADLIASDSGAAHQVAMQQMRGGISAKLNELRTALIDFTALIELELDFAEEDVQFADRTKLLELLEQIKSEITGLKQSFSLGNAIKNGIPAAIIGKPNAGKSTLLNALLKEERAIVSEIAGTTRDTIEETLTIDGYLFRFIDTAGLRETEDAVEKIGVQRSYEKIKSAAVLLCLFDASRLSNKEDLLQEMDIAASFGVPYVLIANKADLCTDAVLHELASFPEVLLLSAKQEKGLDELKKRLVELVIQDKRDNQQAVIITNQRHYESLKKSGEAIQEVIDKMQQQIPSDLITQDIKTALRHLGNITGEIDVDKDILATIFGKFCIGK